jgi:cobyrinic acid a,c-diamide synthase
MITGAVEQHCQTEIIGALPRDANISLPSRHLGLHMGAEVNLNQERLIELMEKYVHLDRLLEIGRQAAGPEPNTREPGSLSLEAVGSVRIGVAWDEAFCFYYQDNLDMLKQAGAEIVVFSPLHDRGLPAGLDGLYLGGGYPELHARILAANSSMREGIKKFSESGRPVYGECGGFMYLTDSIIDARGTEYPMAGIYPVKARMGKRLRRLGYRQVEMRNDTLFGPEGAFCYGHEFHYSEIEPMPTRIERAYVLDDGRAEGYRIRNTLAGYVHLHWGRTPEAARNFVNMMRA